VFIGARAEYITVDGFDEARGFFVRNGNPGLVDFSLYLEPGDAVVFPRDEPIEA
jgi:hypothetical protein